MIENLGLSPINSVVNAGISDFISLFRNGVSTAYVGTEQNRKRVSCRGVLIPERFGSKLRDILMHNKEAVVFQFNPDNIQDSKETYWGSREYTGLGFTDAIWSRGGSRTISFNLFLDDTLASDTDELIDTASYTNRLKQRYTASTRIPVTDRIQTLRELKSYGKTLAAPFQRTPAKLEWEKEGLTTRRHERGVLDVVEKIQSFLYPERMVENNKYTEDIPLFVEGGMVSSHQFRPPATLLFSYGKFVLRGVLLSAPVEYTLFDYDLTPIRANVSVEFKVIETFDLKLTK